MHAPAQAIVQGVYAKHTGLALTALGTAVIISRVFDALTDPLIGWVSDALYQKSGSRKPLLLIGTAVTIVGLWFLFRPPDDVTVGYFLGWFLLSYLGWTLTEIPYRAWSFELSSDHATRTRIQTGIAITGFAGTAGFYLVPYAARAMGLVNSTQIDLQTLSHTAVIIAITLPVINLLAVWRIPDGERYSEPRKPSLKTVIPAIMTNKPLIYFVVILLSLGVVSGMSQGVYFLFIDGYLGLGEQYAGILLLTLPLSVLSLPLWGALCRRFERQHVWACSTVGMSMSIAGLGLIPPGESGLLSLTLCVSAYLSFLACTLVAALSILGDIVDYGRWKFDQDHGGVYTATYTVVQKSVVALSIGLGFLLLDAFGFDPNAKILSEEAVLGMRYVVAWIPATTALVLAPFIWRFPIRRADHQRMMEEISRRESNPAANASNE